MIVINYLIMLSLLSMFLAAYVLIGIAVALITYWLAWQFINHDGLGPRQFWLIVYLPVAAPLVLMYEINKRLRLSGKIVCRFKGHDFGPVVYISPSVLTFCHRCGAEIQDRTIDDLEPATDEDREFLDTLYDNQSY